MKKRAYGQNSEQLVFERLSPEEREMVGGWLEELSFEAGDWPAIPPVRLLLEMLAVTRGLGEIKPTKTADAVRRSSEKLGLQDDERATHPADRHIKLLSRWHKRADSRTAGQDVSPPESEVA